MQAAHMACGRAGSVQASLAAARLTPSFADRLTDCTQRSAATASGDSADLDRLLQRNIDAQAATLASTVSRGDATWLEDLSSPVKSWARTVHTALSQTVSDGITALAEEFSYWSDPACQPTTNTSPSRAWSNHSTPRRSLSFETDAGSQFSEAACSHDLSQTNMYASLSGNPDRPDDCVVKKDQ
ncbi:hypothetical protein WJX73_009147 [Symbiochloris irregularis]|uniref:Uncharacterized protein n=1 Tax=Symbiochloris irregularis TaxID=706552 RepID=A0AAW1PCY7_9CHLO